jgi:hypothetical protein
LLLLIFPSPSSVSSSSFFLLILHFFISVSCYPDPFSSLSLFPHRYRNLFSSEFFLSHSSPRCIPSAFSFSYHYFLILIFHRPIPSSSYYFLILFLPHPVPSSSDSLFILDLPSPVHSRSHSFFLLFIPPPICSSFRKRGTELVIKKPLPLRSIDLSSLILFLCVFIILCAYFLKEKPLRHYFNKIANESNSVILFYFLHIPLLQLESF